MCRKRSKKWAFATWMTFSPHILSHTHTYRNLILRKVHVWIIMCFRSGSGCFFSIIINISRHTFWRQCYTILFVFIFLLLCACFGQRSPQILFLLGPNLFLSLALAIRIFLPSSAKLRNDVEARPHIHMRPRKEIWISRFMKMMMMTMTDRLWKRLDRSEIINKLERKF